MVKVLKHPNIVLIHINCTTKTKQHKQQTAPSYLKSIIHLSIKFNVHYLLSIPVPIKLYWYYY